MFINYGLTFIAFVMGLVLLCGAGILYFRTRTIPTAMFFFGLLLATSSPLIFMALSKLWLNIAYPPIFSIVPLVAGFFQSIGLLLYAISLPKK
jgi:hypothetical protein